MSRLLTPEEAGLTPEQVANIAKARAYYADIKAQREANMHKNGRPGRRITPRLREYTLKAQENRCALCGGEITPDMYFCYNKPTQSIICRACSMLLTAIRKAESKGVTLDMIEAFNHPEQKTENKGEPNVNQ